MAKCELTITIDKPDRTVAPGERITGIVQVRADADVPCNGLTVTREWSTHGKGNRCTGGSETLTLFKGAWSADEAVTYEWAFDVPAGPVTYHGHFLNVDWYIRARADVPWAIDAKAEEEFIVVPGRAEMQLGPEHKAPDAAKPGQASPGCAFAVGMVFLLVGLAIFIVGLVVLNQQTCGGLITLVFGFVFGLIGGAVAYGAIRNTLAQRTLGAVDVGFSSRAVRKGDALGVSAKFTPRAAADVTRVTARLIGRERVISGSGTNKTTHTHGLHEQTVEVSGATRLVPGQPVELTASLPVPVNAAPTFAASENYLEWLVTVHFDLPGRPDWEQDYPIDVVPFDR